MVKWDSVWIALKSVFRNGKVEDELNEEVSFHLEMQTRHNIEKGMDPETAKKKALKSFGGAEKTKEDCRDGWGLRLLSDTRRDTAYGIRQLMKDKGFAIVSVVTLGIGIGACASMFSLVNAVLLKPLPFEDPERLVWIQSAKAMGLSAQTHTVDNFKEFRDENNSFESMGAYFAFFDYGAYIHADERGNMIARVRCAGITEGFIETLGIKLALGRNFEGSEWAFNGPPSVILSHSYWKSHFNSDRGVVGTNISINGRPTNVVGVLPASFDFDSVFTPGTEVEMLVPFPLSEETNRYGNTIFGIGRLKEGVSVEAGGANLKLVSDRIKERLGSQHRRFHHHMNTESLDDRIRGPFRTAFYVLSVAVGCVLAIACVNIANLLIARSNGRRKEFSLRAALGAQRWRLIRQTLVESLILSGWGLALGLGLAYVATNWISGLQAFSIPMIQNVSIDGYAIGFVVLIAGVTGLGCGIFPALQFSRSAPFEALGDESQRGSSGRRTVWLRKGLVVTEVALSCLLLVCAGLLIRSFDRLLDVDLGFEPSNAIAWRVDGGREFESYQERANYYEALLDSIEALPGIEVAGIADTLPLGRNRQWGIVPRMNDGERGPGTGAFPRVVNHSYAEAMGIEVLAGRFFNAFETSESESVIVLNKNLADQLWKGDDPLGKTVFVNGRFEAKVVGVVSDVKHNSLDAAPSNEMYLNFHQIGDFMAAEMVVRSKLSTELLISTVRKGLQEYTGRPPSNEFKTLQSLVDHSVAPERLFKDVLSAFSLVALVLAAVGLYGVIAYSVGQRVREIGIRLAIGASPGRIRSMILTEGVWMTAIGITIGLLGAYGFSRYLSGMLYEVSTTDPFIFALNASVVAGIAILAAFLPARQASKGDPNEALRVE